MAMARSALGPPEDCCACIGATKRFARGGSSIADVTNLPPTEPNAMTSTLAHGCAFRACCSRWRSDERGVVARPTASRRRVSWRGDGPPLRRRGVSSRAAVRTADVTRASASSPTITGSPGGRSALLAQGRSELRQPGLVEILNVAQSIHEVGRARVRLRALRVNRADAAEPSVFEDL